MSDRRPIHPNLARLEAAYDQIVEQFRRGELDKDAARAEMSKLVERDDNHVAWTISPEDGEWYRRTIDGRLVRDDPPTYGMATPSAADVSAGRNADELISRVDRFEVDEQQMLNPDGLTGATRRERLADQTDQPQTTPLWLWMVAGITVLALLRFLVF